MSLDFTLLHLHINPASVPRRVQPGRKVLSARRRAALAEAGVADMADMADTPANRRISAVARFSAAANFPKLALTRRQQASILSARAIGAALVGVQACRVLSGFHATAATAAPAAPMNSRRASWISLRIATLSCQRKRLLSSNFGTLLYNHACDLDIAHIYRGEYCSRGDDQGVAMLGLFAAGPIAGVSSVGRLAEPHYWWVVQYRTALRYSTPLCRLCPWATSHRLRFPLRP